MTEQLLRECEECHGAVGELAVFQHMAKHAADKRDAEAREERMAALVERVEETLRQIREEGVVPAEVDITLVTREEAEALGGDVGQHVPAELPSPTLEDVADEPDYGGDRPFSRY